MPADGLPRDDVSASVARAVPLSKLDDRSLLTRAAQGEREAFGVLVERHAGTLSAILRQKAGRHVPVDDLLQEVFARTLANVGTFRGQASYVTWAASIGMNLAIDWRRKRARRERLTPRADVEHDDVAHPDGAHALETVERRDEARRARAALDALPDVQRLAITLRVVEELTYDDVAERMGVPVGRVRTWVSRGLKRLRDALDREEVSDGR
jgi:RNA polymerase sigma-70 factor (ECF subfamily)